MVVFSYLSIDNGLLCNLVIANICFFKFGINYYSIVVYLFQKYINVDSYPLSEGKRF